MLAAGVGRRRQAMAVAEKQQYAHITFNEHGQPTIDGTRFKVKHLAAEQVYWGWDARKMHEEHPHLTLGQIHSALAYFADHEEEIRQELAEDEREIERMRSEAGPSPLREKILAARLRDAG
jgi:uncharacterized protein (DUF433 family)